MKTPTDERNQMTKNDPSLRRATLTICAVSSVSGATTLVRPRADPTWAIPALTVDVTVVTHHGPVPVADVSTVLVFDRPRALCGRTRRLEAASPPGGADRVDPAAVDDEDHIHRGDN